MTTARPLGYVLGDMSRRRFAPLSLALLLPLACRPTAGPVAPDGGGGTGNGAGVGGSDAMTPLAPVTRAAELLPPRTMMLMDVAGPARLAEIIGRDALVKQFDQEYRKISREMVEEVGVDLLDPKQLTGIGVDVAGRMGVAVIGVEPLTLAFHWSVSDAGRFRQFVMDSLRRKSQEIVSVPMSGAELLRLDGQRAALILRGPLAIFVMQDGGEPKGDPALEIATADPNLALSNDRKFRKATGGLAPADWTTYLDAGAMWERVRSAEEPTGVNSNWARDELAKAKADGATPERIAELERQAKDFDESEKRWADRRKAERELLEKLVGGTGRMVWTVSAKPGGLVGEGQLELGDDGLVRKIVRNHPGSPALPKALAERPVLMFTGALDPAELVGLADLLLRTEGTSWKEMAVEAKDKLAVDLDAELRPLVTGTGGMAVTIDPAVKGAPDPKHIGLAIDIELADAAAASALLDRVAKRAEAERRKRKDTSFALRRDAKTSSWILDVPKWRAVHVSVAGHHLVVSSDPGLAKRLAEGKPGEAPGRTPPAALAAASLAGAAFGGMVDIELMTLFTFARSDGMFSSVSVEEPGTQKAPKSKEYKAKLREVDKARAEVERLQQKEADQELAAWTGVFSPWGALAGNVTEESKGLLARGGLFVNAKGGIAGALLASLTAVKAMSERTRSDDVSRGFETLNRLQGELDAIRQKDVAAWRARQPKAAGVAVPPVVTPGG